MDVSATVTAEGQITLPKEVRDQLGLEAGDRVLFRIVDGRVVVARTPHLLELAGSVPVPEDVRGLTWSEIRDRAHRSQAARNR